MATSETRSNRFVDVVVDKGAFMLVSVFLFVYLSIKKRNPAKKGASELLFDVSRIVMVVCGGIKRASIDGFRLSEACSLYFRATLSSSLLESWRPIYR